MGGTAPGAGPAHGRRLPEGLRVVAAENPSPFTLDGTRTYILGRRQAAIIDPGPARPEHVAAIAATVGAADSAIVLTHLHPDHAAAAEELAGRLGAPVLSARGGTLREGQSIPTDAGKLVAIATPGHTPDHVALHWPDGSAVFVGDLMLGGQETALVAAPEGDLGDYLDSLRRIGDLRAAVLYPAHGPPFTDPESALEHYVRHRELRQRQVLEALRSGAVTEEAVTETVYGPGLHPSLREVAQGAVVAYLHHLCRDGAVRHVSGAWRLEPGH